MSASAPAIDVFENMSAILVNAESWHEINKAGSQNGWPALHQAPLIFAIKGGDLHGGA
ncbi:MULTISPECIES: hypothetical protein [Pseudomonas]|jgi:hypothetical protein|uniref:Uncharacterized protein n=1 Tax=Pseudomonas pergaminensis TaxID=2853159 RepID=A0ABD7TRL1_9PSED|nr:MULTISPECIES: hypothetical protein [Pseudomonas]MBT1259299.1 hypothetical protein [Pseudomonas sp. VS40]MBT1271065.1 hypothetical protein [Pseudomonas sp. VS59]UMY52459.1 hypothetical protein MLC69_05865 [Pseudomonas azotoformans]USW04103.1 hypothetical protein KUA23_05660 [Pseudomonas pergaminensis]